MNGAECISGQARRMVVSIVDAAVLVADVCRWGGVGRPRTLSPAKEALPGPRRSPQEHSCAGRHCGIRYSYKTPLYKTKV